MTEKRGIIVSDGLVVSKRNTPLRKGERVADIEELKAIPTPSVGMLVYVESEGEHHVVKSLKPLTVGGAEIADMSVDEHEPLLGKVNERLTKLESAAGNADLKKLEEAVETLNSDETVEGSVDYKINATFKQVWQIVNK